MTSSFLRSTRNLSSVHSGSGGGWGPLRSSSEPGRGESALRSLLEPWSDCCKYPAKASHWAAMALRGNCSGQGPLRTASKGRAEGTKSRSLNIYIHLLFRHFSAASRELIPAGLLRCCLQAPSIGAASKNSPEERPDPLCVRTSRAPHRHTHWAAPHESFTCQPRKK